MIDADTAITIADDHISRQAAPLAGYRMLRSAPHETAEGWCFAYGIQCDLGIPETALSDNFVVYIPENVIVGI